MTRLLRNTFAASMLVAASMTLAGCPNPGAALPGTGGTMGSGTGTTTTPGGNPVSGNPTQTGNSAACTRDTPSGTPVKGNASMGEYNGQSLPAGYDTYTSQSAVQAAIAKEDGGANWACFQKFYPGATTVYLRNK